MAATDVACQKENRNERECREWRSGGRAARAYTARRIALGMPWLSHGHAGQAAARDGLGGGDYFPVFRGELG